MGLFDFGGNKRKSNFLDNYMDKHQQRALLSSLIGGAATYMNSYGTTSDRVMKALGGAGLSGAVGYGMSRSGLADKALEGLASGSDWMKTHV